MFTPKLPNALRKFIRLEKARIRKTSIDAKTENELISQLYVKVLRKKSENK